MVLVAWGFISVSHIRFMQVLEKRGISRDTLPFKAFFMPYSAYYAAITVFTVALIQGFTVFWNFTATDFSLLIFHLFYLLLLGLDSISSFRVW